MVSIWFDHLRYFLVLVMRYLVWVFGCNFSYFFGHDFLWALEAVFITILEISVQHKVDWTIGFLPLCCSGLWQVEAYLLWIWLCCVNIEWNGVAILLLVALGIFWCCCSCQYATGLLFLWALEADFIGIFEISVQHKVEWAIGLLPFSAVLGYGKLICIWILPCQ